MHAATQESKTLNLNVERLRSVGPLIGPKQKKKRYMPTEDTLLLGKVLLDAYLKEAQMIECEFRVPQRGAAECQTIP